MKLSVRLGILLSLVIAVTYCDGTNKITVPDPSNEKTVISPSNTIGEVKVVAPPTPDPTSQTPYITFGDEGAGVFCNPTLHPSTVYITITKPLDNTVVYGAAEFSALSKTCIGTPRIVDILDPQLKRECGEVWDKPVQVDANAPQSHHIGHIFLDSVRLSIKLCPTPTPTPTPTPSPCVPTWTELPPVVEYGEWSICTPVIASCTELNCTHHRSVITTIKEQNSCDQSIRIKSVTEVTETEPCDCSLGLCYYRVSCGVSSSCTDQNQQFICENTIGGTPAAHGIWLNFVSGALHNHCEFTVPGVSLLNFQLNPGQSDRRCFDKKD